MKIMAGLVLLALLASGQSDEKTPSPLAEVIRTIGGSVVFLRFSPTGRELAVVTQFGPGPILFDTASYSTARTFPIGMRMVAYSPDGTRIATAEGNDGSRIWDAAPKGRPLPIDPQLRLTLHLDQLLQLDTPLQVLQLPSRDSSVRVFWTEFSPDGKRLITTHANGHVKVWDTSSWAVEGDLTLTDTEVRAAGFAPDSQTLVIGDIKGVLHHWSFAKKAEVKTTPTSLGAINGVVFAPDGKTLVTSHQSASGPGVMIWDTASWLAKVKTGVQSAAFSRDGKLLALGGTKIDIVEPVSLTQVRTIELPAFTLRELYSIGPSASVPNPDEKIPVFVMALAFSAAGNTLAAGCVDGSVRLVKINP